MTERRIEEMKVFAHRGYSGKYPENTMLAFRKAEETGCYGIELDVQQTRDGVVVVFHDEEISRVSDEIGNIKDYDYEELRKINVAKLFPSVTKFEPVPTLDEYCEWVKGTELVTNIELKTGVYYYEGLEEKTADIVKKQGLEDRVLFSSGNPMSLVQIRKFLPESVCGVLHGWEGIGNAGYFCHLHGFQCYHPSYKGLTVEDLEICRKYGIQVNVWTVNGMPELERLYSWGVDGIFTNYPEICRAWIDSKEKRKQII